MNIKRRLIGSAAFSSGAKFFHRIIGLISTLILARILTPEDFAMIAIIAITLHFFDILSHTGSEQYIVQKSLVDDADLNTAWTLDIILKSLMCLLLVLFASPIAEFFEQPQLVLAIQVAALTLIINALKNPGIILFKRDLDYKKIFYLSLVQRLVTFTVVLGVALEWRSYWAFIAADVAGAVVFTLGAYQIHKYRPRLKLSEIGLQWRFSKWLLGKSIVGYLRSQVDTVLVAKFFNASQLGNYHMARDMAMLPAHNLLGPAVEPLLADFKDYKVQPEKLGQRVSKALMVVAFIVSPIAVYMAAYPDLIVAVLLGEQWQLAGNLLGIMSWLLFYYVFLLVLENALTALGKVKLIFVFDILSLVLIVTSIVCLLQFSQDLKLLVWLRVTVGIVLTILTGVVLNKYAPLNFTKLAGSISSSMILSVLSAGATYLVMGKISVGLVLSLLISGGIFVAVYLLLLSVILPMLYGWSLLTLIRDYK